MAIVGLVSAFRVSGSGLVSGCLPGLLSHGLGVPAGRAERGARKESRGDCEKGNDE